MVVFRLGRFASFFVVFLIVLGVCCHTAVCEEQKRTQKNERPALILKGDLKAGFEIFTLLGEELKPEELKQFKLKLHELQQCMEMWAAAFAIEETIVDKLLLQEFVCYVFWPDLDGKNLLKLNQTMPEISLVLDLKQRAQQKLLFRIHEAVEKINRFEPSDAQISADAANQLNLFDPKFFEHGDKKMLRVRNPDDNAASFIISTIRSKLVFSTLVPDKTMSFLNAAPANVSSGNGSKGTREVDNDTRTVFFGELNVKGFVKFLSNAINVNLPDKDVANHLNQQIPFLLWDATRKTFELDKLQTAGVTVEFGVSEDTYEQNVKEYLTFDQPLAEGSGLYKILDGGAKLKPPFPVGKHMLFMSRVDLLGVYNSFVDNLDPALNGFLMLGLMQMQQQLGTDIVGLLALFAGDFYLYMGLPERLEQADLKTKDDNLDLEQMFADRVDFTIVCGLNQPTRVRGLIDQFLEQRNQSQFQGNVKIQETDTGKKYIFSTPNNANTEQQILLQVGQDFMMFGMQAAVEKLAERKQQPLNPELKKLLAKHPNAASVMFMTPQTARRFLAYQQHLDKDLVQMVAQLVEESDSQVPSGFKELADKTLRIVADLLADFQQIATAIQTTADSLIAVAELKNKTFELVFYQKYMIKHAFNTPIPGNN